MFGQNRRIGGGKLLANIGKTSVFCVFFLSLILGAETYAKRKGSSKRSGSSKKSNSVNKSSKRSASSKNSTSISKSSKRSGSSKRSLSPQKATPAHGRNGKRANSTSATVSSAPRVRTATNTVENGNNATISEVEGLIADLASDLSSFNTEMKSLSSVLEDVQTRLSKLENGTTVTTTSSNSSTNSTSTSITNEKLGYIKGSADLCKPDSSGHKYCSVAINTDKKFDNGAYCFAWNFYDKTWHMNQNLHSIYTVTGQRIGAYEFAKNKPTLFAMTDFSYYTDTQTKEGSRLHDGKTVVLCGDAIGPGDHNGTQIFDGEILDKHSNGELIFGSHTPFTHPDGSMILFNSGDGVPLIRFNMKQNLLEYKPNLSESYIKALRAEEWGTYLDVRGTKYSKLDW